MAGSARLEREAKRRRTPTSIDVARKAGVSQATVSLVLSGAARKLRLSPATVKRVQAAALSLGYTPNHAARSLRQRRTGIISLVLSTLENPYFGEVVSGAQDAAQARGYAINVIVAKSEDAVMAQLQHLKGGGADGLVMAGRTRRIVEALEDLAGHGVPAAVLKYHSAELTIPSFSIDLDAGGFAAADHLIKLGHRRIAHIADRAPYSERAVDRTFGYRRALRQAGIRLEDAWIASADNSFAGGHEAMLTLLGREPPTAVFAFNDLMAVGALHAIRAAGLSVPGDIAVVGFDGIELGQYTNPTLTTIDHPRHELGRLAVELILDRLDGLEPDLTEHVLPGRLVIRESCGAKRPNQTTKKQGRTT